MVVALFARLRNRQRADGLLGVSLDERGVALARLRRDGRLSRFDLLSYQTVTGAEGWRDALTAQVERYGLTGGSCVCVPPVSHYQLNQVEAPSVAAEEMRSAVRWRLKELIDYPVDEAVVDTFEVPAARGQANNSRLFAVSAHRPVLEATIDTVQASGLQLRAIDIPELVLRNLAAEVPEQGGGVALVTLRESSGLITISRGETLFLARGLDFGVQQLLDGPAAIRETLLLEIQRSLDYYESQLTSVPPSRILFAPMLGEREPLLDYLNTQVGVPTYGLDCEQIIDLEEPCDQVAQAYALLAVGAALRGKGEAV
ncbi:hypothetical protein CAI21_13260 [Alkalilimnicola ehrlichii]|uniref:MSHA biogenesis protein MshI n=1 Tax=Alkalilimnicola ehrlichii TaxID=351052 RepID=A0A3E0WR44_9GAMM|nr:hypothetical protein [Alkalilimnicola ehrlichii]RFA28279.1 hypothetical protein CAI21_13260 [Alkalilimnicola ehrlichii]RFA34879.1 hypothetical protein CAL65_14395 [Alkalilimnicola ehrlichii]